MAVEDHPQYAEWRVALDKYVEASAMYQQAIRQREPEQVVRAARSTMLMTQNLYFEIADKIDYA